MKLFSVIIPTLWKSDKIYKSISKLIECEYVGEIIIINNNILHSHNIQQHSKVKIVDFENNNYVNPSWNYGVSISQFENICLLNDDITISIETFGYLSVFMDDCLVGLSKKCYETPDENDTRSIKERGFYLQKIWLRPKGWGCALFFNKYNYHNIPDDLKIWFGDDWLMKMNPNKCYSIYGPVVNGELSQSSESTEFNEIVKQDVENSKKYELPWSNDY